MRTLSGEFAKFFSSIRYDDLPDAVVLQAKKSILDLIGVAIGGLEMPFARMMVQYLADLGGRPEATLLGTPAKQKVPAIHAALGNGTCGHTLDMDDGYRYGGVHPGVPTIPAALAACEKKDADGKGLILATVLGSEIMNRLARAMNPSHLSRGFHTTGTLGPFGAAAAAGKIYGLPEDQFMRALGMAGLQSAGLLEILHDGAMTKPIHPGKAAMAGILSVELAEKGAQGPATIFEGPKGFFKAMADEVNQDVLLKGLGEQFYILDQYVKLHAACRHVHPAIDGVLELKRQNAIEFADIDSIDILTYPMAISFCGTENLPDSGEAAKFNLPFSVAMAAYFNDAGMNRFCEETAKNPEIRQLARRIRVQAGDKWAQVYPDKRGATLELKTKRGKRFAVDVGLAKGEPENPASMEELLDKFRGNAARMPKAACEQLISVIMELEQHNVSDLTQHFIF